MSNIYELSSSYFDDNGCAIRRLRRTPHLALENLMLFFEQLTIIMQTGKGLDGVDPTTQGYDPVIMVRWSNDGGNTWEDEVWLSFGMIGEFRKRLTIDAMGSSRDRVYEVVCTEPVYFGMVDGFINYSKGRALSR